MNLTRLRYFCVLVEEGSFTRAASRLHLAQQSLSEAVAKLERELHGPLVVRDRRDRVLELTDAGRLLYERGTDLCHRADRLEQQVRDLGDQRTGRLSVGMLGCGAAELTPAILTSFRAAWPRAALTVLPLDFDGFAPALLEGTVDVALMTMPLADDRFVATPLFREPRALMLSEHHRLADAGSLALVEVLDEPFFEVDGAPRRWADYWVARDERGGLPLRPARGVHRTKLQLLMAVAAGGGVMTAPLSTGRFFPYPGLRFVPLTEPGGATVAVITRRDGTNPLAAAFGAVATRVAAGLLPELVPHADPALPV